MKSWFITAAVGVALFAAIAAVFVSSLWVTTEFVDDKEVRVAAAFVFGFAFLLAIIAGIAVAFHALELTTPKSAFGLPEGSIRAIIALVLVLIFVLMSIYMIEAVFLNAGASEQAQTAATQILATVGTLVAAVAAFYFGTAAVTTGTRAATAAVASARAPAGPSATTKGSKAVEEGYELVGIVNPHGQETQYFFEYGQYPDYGNKTVPASAGAANAEHEVNSLPLPLEKGWHLRVVAFNDSGTSYGKNAVVTDDPLPVTDTEAETETETATGGPEAETTGESETETGEPEVD